MSVSTFSQRLSVISADQVVQGSFKRVLARQESIRTEAVPTAVQHQLARRGSHVSMRGLQDKNNKKLKLKGKVHLRLLDSPAIAKGFGGAVASATRSKSPKDYRQRQRRKDLLPKEVSPKAREDILHKEQLRREGSIHLATQPAWWRGEGRRDRSPSSKSNSKRGSRSASPRESRYESSALSCSGSAMDDTVGSPTAMARRLSMESIDDIGNTITEVEVEDDPNDAADAVRLALVHLASIGRGERRDWIGSMDARAAQGRPSERIRVSLPNAARNVAYSAAMAPGQGMKISSVLEGPSRKLQQLKHQALKLLSHSAEHGEKMASDLRRLGASPKTAARVRDMFANADTKLAKSPIAGTRSTVEHALSESNSKGRKHEHEHEAKGSATGGGDRTGPRAHDAGGAALGADSTSGRRQKAGLVADMNEFLADWRKFQLKLGGTEATPAQSSRQTKGKEQQAQAQAESKDDIIGQQGKGGAGEEGVSGKAGHAGPAESQEVPQLKSLSVLEGMRIAPQAIVSRGAATLLREQADAAIKTSRQDAADRETARQQRRAEQTARQRDYLALRLRESVEYPPSKSQLGGGYDIRGSPLEEASLGVALDLRSNVVPAVFSSAHGETKTHPAQAIDARIASLYGAAPTSMAPAEEEGKSQTGSTMVAGDAHSESRIISCRPATVSELGVISSDEQSDASAGSDRRGIRAVLSSVHAPTGEPEPKPENGRASSQAQDSYHENKLSRESHKSSVDARTSQGDLTLAEIAAMDERSEITEAEPNLITSDGEIQASPSKWESHISTCFVHAEVEISKEDLQEACVGDLLDSIADVFGIVPISIVYNGYRMMPEDEDKLLSDFGEVLEIPTVEVELTEEQVASLEDGGDSDKDA